jgi:hypothetical protein
VLFRALGHMYSALLVVLTQNNCARFNLLTIFEERGRKRDFVPSARTKCFVVESLGYLYLSSKHKSVHRKNILISNKMQRYTVYFIWKLLCMFRVVFPPIIRSANNCICRIWYLSHRYCYLPLSWKSWNRFECAMGGIRR